MRPSPRAAATIALLLPLLLASLTPTAETAPKPAGSAPKPAAVTLQNPDFERTVPGHSWMPVGWDTSMADLPTVFFGRDTFLVQHGQYAVNVANMSNAFPMAHNWNQTLLVGPELWGKQATLKVWTRNNGVEGRAYIMLQAYSDTASKMGRIWGVDHDEALKRLGINKIDDPLLDLAWKRTQFNEPLTEWVQRESRIVIPPGTNVLFVRCGLLGIGQVVFDNASLTFGPAPASAKPALGTNLFADAGFEAGGIAWDIGIPPYEGSRVDVDSTVAHEGRRSVRLSNFFDGVVEARIGVAQPFRGRSLRGQRVRLSAWLKGDSLRGAAMVKVYSHGLKTRMTQSPAAELMAGTFDWTQVQIEFDVPEDSEQVWAHVLAFAPQRGTVWIDDAKFEVIGPAKGPRQAPPAKTGAASASPGKSAPR